MFGIRACWPYDFQTSQGLKTEQQPRLIAAQAWMGSVVGVLQFLISGVQSNWWGLSFPLHCGSTTWGALISSYLLGLIGFPLDSSPFGSLGLLIFEVNRWSNPPLSLLALPGTCMSQTSEPDSEVVDLSVSFGGLSVSIRGSPDRAAAFVRDLASNHSSDRSLSGFGSGPSVATSNSYSFVPSLPAPLPAAEESRPSIRESFPPVPARWLDFVADLAGSRLSGQHKKQRAWLAGFWAGAAKRERIGTPDRTPSIELSNRFYVVVRCRNPRVFASHRSFHRAVGSLAGTNTICHGFPVTLRRGSFWRQGARNTPLHSH